MKKILISAFVVALGVSFNSCSDDWLTLMPDREVPTGELANSKEYEASMNGVYNLMAFDSSNGYYYARNFMYYGEVRADDQRANGVSKRSANLYTYRYNVDNAPSDMWSRPYVAITNANNMINSFDGIVPTDSDDSVKLYNILGEALTARALCYFDMVRVFGYPYIKDQGASLGMPIVDEVVDVTYKPTRNTVSECYDFILGDLVRAVGTLVAGDANKNGIMSEAKYNGHFNRWTAMHILSRVYLFKGDYANAYKYAPT